MQAGKDFPSYFELDNYSLRHTTGHNMLDPESVITGEEISRGMSYDNSHREWRTERHYYTACTGEQPVGILVSNAPRRRNNA